MKTKAVKKADQYLLNGSKNWITYAQVADIGIIYAYTDPSQKHKGISAFIVDLHSKGVGTGPTAEKMGWHACPTGEIYFDEVEVPVENLLGGKEKNGFSQVMASLNNTRLTAAAGAVGVSQGLIDEAHKVCQGKRAIWTVRRKIPDDSGRAGPNNCGDGSSPSHDLSMCCTKR